MASAKEIKRKIGSIKNTQKITRAMELISTVKMKKAQDLALSKREFVLEMSKIFMRIEKHLNEFSLFKEGVGNKTLAVLITSNKGLCGGYNINVMKRVNKYVKETGEDLDYITIGKKAANFVVRTGNNLIADFSKDFSDYIEAIFSKEISKMLVQEFLSGKYKKIVIFYNHYLNTITQIPIDKIFLPISPIDIKKYLKKILKGYYDLDAEEGIDINAYTLEPNSESLVEDVIPMILDMLFNDKLLEAKASEHSSRMVAMKAAKDNAGKIAGGLTLKYNKARQALITREVSEIIAGVESMKDI